MHLNLSKVWAKYFWFVFGDNIMYLLYYHTTHASAVLYAINILFLCLSIHRSHACFVRKPNNALWILIPHERAITLVL